MNVISKKEIISNIANQESKTKKMKLDYLLIAK